MDSIDNLRSRLLDLEQSDERAEEELVEQSEQPTGYEQDYPTIRKGDRALAALTYVGVLPFVIIGSRPGPTFIRRHLRLAAIIHLIRIVWAGAIVSAWWLTAPDVVDRTGQLVRDLMTIGVFGIPVASTWSTDALPWLLTPIVLTWLLSLAGFILAATGHTADFHAFANSDWTDPVRRRRFLYTPPEEEREQARRARERQIERLQKSSQMMRSEHARRSQIADLETQIERLDLQREYYDQLLALGEISQRRYEIANQELDDQAADLAGQLSSLQTRVQVTRGAVPDSLRMNRLSRPAETVVESIAIVTPDGIPIFAYGQFQLDEALVAGMLSAFDSLSAEVFGSRVHKTALAEGQVLYFAHGDFVLIMATFDDEPAPRQVEQLRTMLRQFEAANHSPLARGQFNPAYLHEVPLPFKFAERLPRREPARRTDA